MKKAVLLNAGICLVLAATCQVWAIDNNDIQKKSAGWKWDVNIYDRSGWFTPWFDGPRLNGDEILIRCTSHPEDVYADDFYSDKSEAVTLSSTDGGMSWQETSPERFDKLSATVQSDGIKVSLDTKPSFSHELDQERRKKLQELGLGNLADKTGWIIFPESMSTKLKAMGYDVYDSHPMIPQGQAAVFSAIISGKWSADNGKTWNDSKMELPSFAHGPVNMGNVQLSDGTRLWFYYGCELYQKGRCNYVLRSTDNGKSWKMTKISSDPNWCLSEASPIVLPGGRVLVLMRCDAGDGVGYIHSSYSDDGGLTWMPAVRTKMWGSPIGVLSLKSGAVLCTYAYRRFPGGVRACLSYDKGQTWDIAHEKILRDDIIPTCWLSPGGAQSVQLKDGTIFTAYTLQKAGKLEKGDTAGGNVYRVTGINNGRFHCYLAGCRYTEDYVRSLPVQNSVQAAEKK